MQAFVNASRDGWLNYLNGNPAPANALIKRDNPDMTDAIIAQAIDKMKRYGLVISGDAPRLRPGRHDRTRWKHFLRHDGSPRGFIPKAWTIQGL